MRVTTSMFASVFYFSIFFFFRHSTFSIHFSVTISLNYFSGYSFNLSIILSTKPVLHFFLFYFCWRPIPSSHGLLVTLKAATMTPSTDIRALSPSSLNPLSVNIYKISLNIFTNNAMAWPRKFSISIFICKICSLLFIYEGRSITSSLLNVLVNIYLTFAFSDTLRPYQSWGTTYVRRLASYIFFHLC